MNSFWKMSRASLGWNRDFYQLAQAQWVIPIPVSLKELRTTMLNCMAPKLIATAMQSNAILRYFMRPTRHEVLDQMVDCAMMEEYNAKLQRRES